MANEERKLSRLERIFLTNQLRILEALYPNEADGYAVQREALEHGYEMVYDWHFQHVYDDVMTSEESREVWDTLEMFDAIDRCASTTTDEFINKHHLRKFAGYDGNNETKFMTFARFTVERLERFEGVPMREKDRWNSHMPIREVYWRMLRAWRQVPSERRLDLTVDEVKKILAETVHPEKR